MRHHPSGAARRLGQAPGVALPAPICGGNEAAARPGGGEAPAWARPGPPAVLTLLMSAQRSKLALRRPEGPPRRREPGFSGPDPASDPSRRDRSRRHHAGTARERPARGPPRALRVADGGANRGASPGYDSGADILNAKASAASLARPSSTFWTQRDLGPDPAVSYRATRRSHRSLTRRNPGPASDPTLALPLHGLPCPPAFTDSGKWPAKATFLAPGGDREPQHGRSAGHLAGYATSSCGTSTKPRSKGQWIALRTCPKAAP
jgi:hypothetical protein